VDANATCPVAQPGTGTIRTSGLRGLAQVMVEGQAKRTQSALWHHSFVKQVVVLAWPVALTPQLIAW
jgi:hypothetical protein